MYRYERSDLLLLILAWNMVFQIITDHSVQIHDFLGFIILGYIINTGILKARVSIKVEQEVSSQTISLFGKSLRS